MLQESSVPVAYDKAKHRIALQDTAGNDLAYFRLPLLLSDQGHAINLNYVILLIQAGNCALGYFENGANLDHKVFRSYMVRKKQGKSQIKYLKTKGKSRSGSRVRLGETLEFFENINERLQSYFEENDVQRIALSCSKTLLPYLFSSKVETPFTKSDSRLYKVPKHVHTPIYEVLLDANKFLMKGELIYEAAHQKMVADLLGDTGMSDYLEEDEETEDDDMEW